MLCGGAGCAHGVFDAVHRGRGDGAFEQQHDLVDKAIGLVEGDVVDELGDALAKGLLVGKGDISGGMVFIGELGGGVDERAAPKPWI